MFFLGLTSFFNDLSSEMIYPLLPFFLTEVLGAGALLLGLLEGLAELVSSLLKLFSGWWSDRLRRSKGLVVAGYSMSAVARTSLAVVAAPWQALGAWLLNRVGKGVRTSPRDALIASSCPSDARGRAFGYHRAMDHLGALSGAAAASVLMALALNVRAVFAWAAVPAGLALLALVMGVRETRDGQSCREEAGGGDPAPPTTGRRAGSQSLSRDMWFFLAAVFLFTLGNSSDAFLLLRARQAGMSPVLLPALWGVFHVVKAVVSVPGGTLSDRWGRKKTILLGWGIYVLAYAGFAFMDKTTWAWLLFPFYGTYYLVEPVEKALVADLCDPRARGRAYGMYNFAVSVTILPASLLMGWWWEVLGPGRAFLPGAGLALLASLLLLGVRERKDPGQEI
ncbi:MAG: MFS transporter [Candidatus Geothermincolales bacterium]